MNRSPAIWVASVWFMAGPSILAQNEPTISLSGSTAATIRGELNQREAQEGADLRLGPTFWQLSSRLGLEFNSNIGLEPSGKEKFDFIYRPIIKGEMIWSFPEANQLTIGIGGGYAGYAAHQEYSRWFIVPGSELGLNLYVGRFWIEVHDRLGVTTENYQDPTAANVADYSELRNEAGASALCDLNALRLRIGFDHLNQVRIRGNGERPSGQQDLFWSRIGHPGENGNEAGVEVGGGWRDYQDPSMQSDQGAQWNAGLYWEGRLSPCVQARGSIGHMEYFPRSSGETLRGMYGQLELIHRLNPWVRYTLSGGRRITTSLFAGTLDYYRAGFLAEWTVLRRMTLATGFTFESGEDFAAGTEDFERYGANLSIGRMLTDKLRVSAGYQFYRRLADQKDREYQDHIGEVRFTYEF